MSGIRKHKGRMGWKDKLYREMEKLGIPKVKSISECMKVINKHGYGPLQEELVNRHQIRQELCRWYKCMASGSEFLPKKKNSFTKKKNENPKKNQLNPTNQRRVSIKLGNGKRLGMKQ